MRILLCVLVAAAAVRAQDGPIPRSSLDMMAKPIDPRERQAIVRAWQGPENRARKVRQQLARLGRGKAAERAELEKQLAAIHAEQAAALREAGLSADAIARLQAMPRGALREERWHHALVLEAPGLSAAQLRRLARMVATADGAQAALRRQRELILRTLPKDAETARQAVRSQSNYAHRDTEQRFWLAAYYVLKPEQMIAVREHFSPRYRNLPNLQEQLYLTPELTPSQANRVRALFAQHEAESAVDQTEVRRIGRELKGAKVSKDERIARQRARNAAYGRLTALGMQLREDLLGLLTDAQEAALRSRAPMLGPNELDQQGLRRLRDVPMRPAQRQRMQALLRELEQEQRKTNRAAQEELRDMGQGELGAESPQMMSMQMVQRGARVERIERIRKLGRQVMIEILEPVQIANWIVALESNTK